MSDAPAQIASFEILARLGKGGMAEVFRAKKRGAEGIAKEVVLKRILPSFVASRRFQEMFIDEAQLATRLNHPNVVQVYEFSNEGDQGYVLAMEYVEGCDLGRLLREAREQATRVDPWLSAWIVSEAAKGLHYAHEKRDDRGAPLEIVHRDVSPQNVLLSYDGAVKIADFGIASARLVEEEAGVLKGKFGYMSPEQARGEKVDRRSDLYALGVILWECITGRPLHGGLGGEALLDIVRSGIVEPPRTYAPDLPEELESIVLRCLAPDREARFATGRELASAIGRALLHGQIFVDAGTLESTIAQLVPRAAADAGPPSEVVLTHADAPRARKSAQPSAPDLGEASDPGGSDVPARTPARPSAAPREVRHVAVVSMHLVPRPTDADAPLRRADLVRTLERARPLLGDMAYKRGTRWVWTGDLEARAVVGLSSRPARAAVDAAWLALETHEALEAIREDLPVSVEASLSIVRGIASGHRDADGNLVEHDLHEPAHVLADALGRVTPIRRSWVAGGVYRLLRRDFRWGDAPELDLRNYLQRLPQLPPNMRVYALERALTREEREHQASGDLAGREAEKGELHAAFHAAVSATGGGRMTCRAVVGELGIGKTALVATFLSELPPNARLVRVECSPVRMEVPYAAVSDVVRDAIGVTGEEPYEEIVHRIAHLGGGSARGDHTSPIVARLAEIASRLRGEEDEEDARSRKKQILVGLRMLLAALALDQPLVVLVESLQWADRPSLELCQELLKGNDPLPILVLLVTRPDDRVDGLLEGKVRVELRGLGAEEQVQLVASRLGVREGIRPVLAELMPRVGGNPFYLLEILDAMLERGTLEIHGETLARTDRADAEGLPSTLEQLLADRLRELPASELAACAWLAVAGGPLRLGDLRALGASGAWDDGTSGEIGRATESSPGFAVGIDRDVSDRLVDRGLCERRGDQLEFRHLLTRDVAYQQLAAETRVRMHRVLGEHLATTPLARGLSAAIVARHLARGDARERAAPFYIEAARAARAGFQMPLAIRYFLRASAFLPRGDARALDVHAALEAIFRILGKKHERSRHLEHVRRLARERATPEAACLALIRLARYHLDELKLDRGLGVAKSAALTARRAGLVSFEIEAEEIVSEALRDSGDVQGALAAIDRALAASNPQVNPEVPARDRADVLRSRGALLRRLGRVREAVDGYADAIAVYRKTGARRQEARAKNALAYAMLVQGRYEDAIALALESIRLDLSVGGRFQISKTLSNVGQAYAKLGDLPRALVYLGRARDVHERYGDRDGYVDTLLVTAEARLEMDEVDAASELVRLAEARLAEGGSTYDQTHWEVVSAALARARREPHAAIAHAVKARRESEAQALVAFHFYAMALEAAARTDAGEVHAATLLATTAMGAVDALQGCEFGLEVRVLAADVLKRAGSPQARVARQRAVDFAQSLRDLVREPRLARSFAERPLVAGLFDDTPAPPERASVAPAFE